MENTRTEKGPRVIVAGQNYGSILTMVRDLGQAGYDVAVIRVFKKAPSRLNILGRMTPEKESRYVSLYRQCVTEGDPENLYRCLLDLSVPGQRTPVLCVDDFLVAMADEMYDRLKELFSLSNIDEEPFGIVRQMDKARQKEAAKAAGLSVLDSVTIEVAGGTFEIPAETPYPCFIKPQISMRGNKLSMTRCEDKEELENILTAFAESGDLTVLAESFVEVQDEFAVLGAAFPGRVWIPGAFRTTLSGHRERKGVAVMGEIADHPELPAVLSACAKMVESMGYTGLFDIDLLEDIHGHLHFIEMNFRGGASIHLFSGAGANLPAAFADYMTEGVLPEEAEKSVSKAAIFVSEKALMEEYVHGDVTGAEMKRYLSMANVPFIRDEEDPAPWQYFKKYLRRAKVLRIPYRVRDKRWESK